MRAPAASPDLALRKLLRRFMDVCNAIDYAHSRGVIHRDLKPANIIVGKHGETLVVDWGLAKPTARAAPGIDPSELLLMPTSASGSAETLPGSALGTPAYMSPEQAAGQLDRLSPRSDVYSLGATLYCLLTGKPPFGGDDVGEILRAVQQGRFQRPLQHDPSLDRALEAVCLKAMATRPEDRYPTPKALAEDLERWMADEPVTAWPEPFPRRAGRWARRNRTAVTSLAASVLVALAGTAVVLAVQTQANGRFQRANSELALANDRVTKANTELNSANLREKERFNLAMDAIKLFHGEVSEDLLLKEKQFEALRTKLLKGAADFYGRLEGLLKGQTDRESQIALGTAYAELALLTGKIGDQKAALALLDKALAVRRALASEPGANAWAKLALAGSLDSAGWYKRLTGDMAGARASYEEARRLAEEADTQGGAPERAREMLGDAYHGIAMVLGATGDAAGSQAAYNEALAIRQKLADATPANARFLSDLAGSIHNTASILESQGYVAEALAMYERARSISESAVRIDGSNPRYQVYLAHHHNNIGNLLFYRDDMPGAQAAYSKGLAIRQKLANANPSVTEFQQDLAASHVNMGLVLSSTGDPDGAKAAYGQALAIQQKLADANPGVTGFQQVLARSHHNLGLALFNTGDPHGALAAYGKAMAIRRKLADANASIPEYRENLANTQAYEADVFRRLGRKSEAREGYDRAIVIRERLIHDDPKVTQYRVYLAWSLRSRGLARLEMDDPAGAAADTRRAREVWSGLPSRSSLQWFETACCHACLTGLAGRPGSGVSAAEGADQAEKAMAALRQAITMGYRKPSNYRTESALDPLRDRPDFQGMMMDLVFPTKPFAPGN